MELKDVIRLYYRYKRTDDETIANFLEKVKLVSLTNKGIGTIEGYYEIIGERLDCIKKEPRKHSLTFDLFDEDGKLDIGEYQNLNLYKKQTFLVKSSSRFFYKPDIGEIIDAISFQDKLSGKIHAIDIDCSNYQLLPETEGEHFLCTVNLLTKDNR